MKLQEFVIAAIAKVAHEANKAYCETLGDMTQKPWDEADQWQRDSAIDGVKFKLDNPNSTPEDQHEAWLKAKLHDGWTYSEVKDAEKKIHPCMVPYDQLPQEQKIKDYLFGAVVEAFRKGMED